MLRAGLLLMAPVLLAAAPATPIAPTPPLPAASGQTICVFL